MSKLPRILCASIASLSTLVVGSPLLSAATIDTFEIGGLNTPAIAGQHGTGAGPSFATEGDPGATNRFLRIISGVNSQNNSYTYERADVGAFEKTVATFDFRITPGTAGLADGLGFLLIPTSSFGTSGIGPLPTAEEPNVAGAFGLGIDVYPGINNISTHFNGAQMTEMNPAPNVSFRDNGVFNRVQVELERVGNGTHAKVTITPDIFNTVEPGVPYKIFETLMPNMLPYEYRAQFLGRTGGENMTLDVDNLSVTSSVPFDPAVIPQAPVASIGHLYQDFDSSGTTFYRAVQVNNTTPEAFQPGPLIKTAEAGNATDGNFLRVVNDGINNQGNRIIFDRARDSGASNATEILEFDLRFNSTDQPADGLGLLFVPTINPDGADTTGGGGIDSSEEPNHAGMLGIGFDVYPNGDPDVAPGVSLHYDGITLRDVPLPAEIGLGSFHHVKVVRESVAGGLNVSVIATPDVNGAAGAPVTLIDKFFVEGARNYDNRVQFSGRTGGLNGDNDLDNIMSSQIGRAPMARTQATFANVLEAPYKAYGIGAGAGPAVRNDFIDAVNGDYLRLVHDGSNGQSNTISFDKQLDGSINGATTIKGEFAFRIGGVDQPADGFSLMIMPTSTYGDSGIGAAATAGLAAEAPKVPGVFGIGFDLYNGGGIEFNEVTANWDGQTFGTNQLTGILNLDNDVFNKVRFELRAVEGGTLLDMSIVGDIYNIPGAEIVVFDDVLLPGMELFDYRVEFAARTGGLNMRVDLDDILVQTVPEPGSALLLAIGGVAMSGFRRNRKKRA